MAEKNQNPKWYDLDKIMSKRSFVDRIVEEFLSSADKTSFSWKDKILFYKELVYMMKWWVSLLDTMRTIQTTSDNAAVKWVAKAIYGYLDKGKQLSYAISRLPEYFDEWDAAIIKTGEISGNLPNVLQSLAEEYAYLSDIKQKYVGAMIYPVALIIISIVAIIYLFWFVLPWLTPGKLTHLSPITDSHPSWMIIPQFTHNFAFSPE